MISKLKLKGIQRWLYMGHDTVKTYWRTYKGVDKCKKVIFSITSHQSLTKSILCSAVKNVWLSTGWTQMCVWLCETWSVLTFPCSWKHCHFRVLQSRRLSSLSASSVPHRNNIPPPLKQIRLLACSSRLQTAACPCARAIDSCSCARQKPTRAMANQSAYTYTCANQNATVHLRQSGLVSCRHA